MNTISKFLSTPLGEVIKEALRFAVLGFVSILVQQLLLGFSVMEQTPGVLALVLGLRFIDSALHKSKVAEKGLVRF